MTFNPDWVVAPGEILEEHIKARGMKKGEFEGDLSMVSVNVNGLNWVRVVLPKGNKAECEGCKKMVTSVWRSHAINSCIKCVDKWSK